MYKLLTFIFLFMYMTPCSSQNIENVFGDDNANEDSLYTDDELQPEIKPDTVLIKNTISVSPDSISTLQRKKEFAYVPRMDSLLKSQSNSSTGNMNRPVSIVERFLNSAFLRFFIWLIPIALVLVVLYNFLQSRGTFRKKKENHVQEEGDEEMQSTNHNYLRLAREAAGAGNFRPAVKYLFLRTLQKLSEAGLINYASDKTNYKYVQEISADKKKEFARLVLNYEYVWYGNVAPDQSMYTKIESEFNTFFQKYNLN